jgi:hypothetical protein
MPTSFPRKNVYLLLFDSMRRALAVETEALDPLALEEIGGIPRAKACVSLGASVCRREFDRLPP